MNRLHYIARVWLTVLCVAYALRGQEMIPAAILPFMERGLEASGKGDQVCDLLFVALAASETLILVDRMELNQTLQEHELNLSGMVNAGDATRVGQLTGAKLLITGSVMIIGDNLYLVAKIIGTETTRVLAATAKGTERDDLDTLVTTLGEQIEARVKQRGAELLARPEKREDVVASLNEALGGAQRPTVYVRIDERHVGQLTIDPAAETELAQLCSETGFTLIDPDSGRETDADVIIRGEGFSEFALRRGNLVSVKARLEVKAVDAVTKRILATDSQVTVTVDLTEQLAGKAALQKASRQLAARLLPRLMKEYTAAKTP